jgi:hypothetical protein
VIRRIHRLVLETFVGPCPPGMVCAHNDGNATNNQIDNLRCDTHQANCDDRLRHGTLCRGEAARHARLKEAEVLEIRRLRAGGMKIGELAALFNVGKDNIKAIIYRRSWRHLLPSAGKSVEVESLEVCGVVT